MEKSGGTIKGETSFEAEKSKSGQMVVSNATNTSVLKLQGKSVTGVKTVIQGGYRWDVTSTELQDAYDKATRKAYVEVECTNTNSDPILYLNTENNFTLLPE